MTGSPKAPPHQVCLWVISVPPLAPSPLPWVGGQPETELGTSQGRPDFQCEQVPAHGRSRILASVPFVVKLKFWLFLNIYLPNKGVQERWP